MNRTGYLHDLGANKSFCMLGAEVCTATPFLVLCMSCLDQMQNVYFT